MKVSVVQERMVLERCKKKEGPRPNVRRTQHRASGGHWPDALASQRRRCPGMATKLSEELDACETAWRWAASRGSPCPIHCGRPCAKRDGVKRARPADAGGVFRDICSRAGDGHRPIWHRCRAPIGRLLKQRVPAKLPKAASAIDSPHTRHTFGPPIHHGTSSPAFQR